ncbi:MAG: DUF3603 family protein [Firmicutes bacterium]|nr:DUF3603 family protein [Bacillota bacterium]
MIYIYDILLNFNDGLLYEFYEWSSNDDIENMKKIKLVKVDKRDFDCFSKCKVCIDSSFLLKIFKTCEVYTNKSVEVIDYCCLFSDGSRVLAIEFDKNGESICRSKLLLDEEEEISSLASNLEFTEISYRILNEEIKERFLTRKEIKVQNYLLNEIKDTYQKKNYNKLKFLYYECFENEISSYKLMYQRLTNSVLEQLDDVHIRLYDLLRLAYKKKQV